MNSIENGAQEKENGFGDLKKSLSHGDLKSFGVCDDKGKKHIHHLTLSPMTNNGLSILSHSPNAYYVTLIKNSANSMRGI